MNQIWDLISNSSHRLIYPQMGGMGLKLVDYTIFEVYEDHNKLLEIALKMDEKFPLDFSYPLDFGTIFLHTWQVPLLRPDYDFPSAIENPIDSLAALEKLKVLDPHQDGLMPEYLKGIRKIAQAIPKPLMVASMGPFTLAAELVGVSLLAKSTIKNPEFVERVLDFTTENICNFIRALKAAGARVIQISEPTTVVLSPQVFHRFVTPRLKRIMDLINDGAISSIHICGDTRSYLDEMLAAGPQILSLDQIMPMEQTIKRIPEQVALAGNLDPINLMLNAAPEEVYAATKDLLKMMEPYPNFMVSFGCDCPVDTPTMNFFSGKLQLTGQEPSVSLILADKELVLPVSPDIKLEPEAKDGLAVVIGVRPEHLKLHPKKQDENDIGFTVSQKELVGGDILLYGEAAGVPLVCRLPESREIYEYQAGYVSFAPEHIYLFCAETEKNLLLPPK